MANITGSFNLVSPGTYTDRYTLNDGNTGVIGQGVALAYTGGNPAITFKFSSANKSESLTNSGTISSTGDRALSTLPPTTAAQLLSLPMMASEGHWCRTSSASIPEP
jgi:hypothetical protein